MAKPETFQCSVITPERSVLECEARFVAFPAHDGEMGILRGRAPLVCKLGIGTLRVEAVEGTQSLFVDGGFAQMLDNRFTVLTSQAKFTHELDPVQAEKALGEARTIPVRDDASLANRAAAVQRAQAQVKLARRRE